MRVLFVENHDSFSWNVIDRLPFTRAQLVVASGREAAAGVALLDGVDSVVIGPGPLDPERAGLVELVREVARRKLPLLGICLGHQALGMAFGARLVRTPPAHGKRDVAWFSPSRFFRGFDGPEKVMRYHSLALEDVPAPLRVVATTSTGLPMAIEHASLPMAGLQFHPDSFATPRGEQLLAAFFRAVA